MKIHSILKRSLFLLPLAVLWISCEKEVDIKLDGVEKKYVIEGVVTDQAGGCKVLVSKTKDFSEDNSRITVSGAIVRISDGSQTIQLVETAAGEYTASTLQGVPGVSYQLSVQVGSDQFSGRSTMPQKVPMDSLYISREFLFDETENLPTISYQDPPGVLNYYRFVLYVNDGKKRDIFAYDDDLIDGNSGSVLLYYVGDDDDDDPRNDKIKSGDLVRVETLNIDAGVYKYFFSLASSATGDSNGTTPANPVSNLTGGALGYFSAQTVQSKEVRVP